MGTMHRAPTLLFYVVPGLQLYFYIRQIFGKSFFFEEKVISYWFLVIRQKSKDGFPFSWE